jgi:hypothetical protein
MSSPIVTGIAALYLQKCKMASYSDFKMDLTNSTISDAQSGLTPNFGYGFGKVNAHELILQKHNLVNISGPSGICAGQTVSLGFNSNIIPTSVIWSNGSQSNSVNTAIAGSYSVTLTDQIGCRAKGTKNLSSFPLPFVDAGPNRIICPNSTITLSGTGEAVTYSWNKNVQNNVPFIPTSSGFYAVTGTSTNGCISKDSSFIDFFTVQPVSYTEGLTSIGLQDLAFNVSPGIPSGGFYSGDGVIGTSFHPSLAGLGDHYIVYSIVDANGCTSSDSSLIVVYNNVGLKELETTVRIFPNPAKDYLTIQSDEIIELTCYFFDGKIIEKMIVEKEFVLNTSNYANGIYFFQFKNYQSRKPLYFIKN